LISSLLFPLKYFTFDLVFKIAEFEQKNWIKKMRS